MQNRNTIITGVVALVVGLLIGWAIGHGSASKSAMTGDKMMANSDSAMMDDDFMSDSNSDTGSMMNDDAMMMESDAAVMVADQAAGDMVTVASVETDDSTWVAVRETANGVVGKILGASRVDAGASSNVMVNLLRPTVSGQDYVVVLFSDNGDRMFDNKTDMPMTSDGAMISQPFKAE